MPTITHERHDVHFDLGARTICLTDMWRAAKGTHAQRPTEWLRSKGAIAFIDFLAKNLENIDPDALVGLDRQSVGAQVSLVSTKTGFGGSTWAHWQVGLAYAQELSPAFRAWFQGKAREVFLRPQKAPEPVPEEKPLTPARITRTAFGALQQLQEFLDDGLRRRVIDQNSRDLAFAKALSVVWGFSIPAPALAPIEVPDAAALNEPALPPLPEATEEPAPATEPQEGSPLPAVPLEGTWVRQDTGDPDDSELTFVVNLPTGRAYTGRGAARAIDTRVEGLFTRWMHFSRKSKTDGIVYSDSTLGREFNRLARHIGFHPLAAKGYDGPKVRPDVFAIEHQVPCPRTGPDGTPVAGTRTACYFLEAGLLAVANFIRTAMDPNSEPLQALPE